MNLTLEERYENFEGDMRRFDELIGQLELWCDECTINHKKEEVRLPQYVELNDNLQEWIGELKTFIAEQRQCADAYTERLDAYEAHMQDQLEAYKVTELCIYEWIREIKNIHILIMKSPVLQEHKAYLESILAD